MEKWEFFNFKKEKMERHVEKLKPKDHHKYWLKALKEYEITKYKCETVLQQAASAVVILNDHVYCYLKQKTEEQGIPIKGKIRWLGTEEQIIELVDILDEMGWIDPSCNKFYASYISAHFENAKGNEFKNDQLRESRYRMNTTKNPRSGLFKIDNRPLKPS